MLNNWNTLISSNPVVNINKLTKILCFEAFKFRFIDTTIYITRTDMNKININKVNDNTILESIPIKISKTIDRRKEKIRKR